MSRLSPPRPSVRRTLTRAASALALFALVAGGASAQSTFTSGLVSPFDVTRLADGTVVVAEFGNFGSVDGRISAITEGGGRTTIPGGDANITTPTSVVQLANGDLLVSQINVGDATQGVITRITSTGTQTQFASGLNSPQNLTVLANGDVLVVETAGGLVTRVTPGGVKTTFASGFNSPSGVTQLASGDVLVTERGTGTVYQFAATAVDEARTDGTVFASGLGAPRGVFRLDDGRVLVSNDANVLLFNADGTGQQTVISGGPYYFGQLADGRGLVAQPSSNNVVSFTIPSAAADPVVTLSASPTTIDEDGGTSTITASLPMGETADGNIVVGLSTEGDGFTLANSITIADGANSGTATLTAQDDADTDDETVTVSIDSVTGNATEDGDQSVVVTITDDDTPAQPTVSLSVSDNDITEGESTQITATLDDDATADGAVTVQLGFNPAPDGEYSVTAGSITIPDGQSSGSVTFLATDDEDDEADLTVAVSIASVTGNADENGDQEVDILIRDNDEAAAEDPLVSLSVSDNDITEGESTQITAALADGATADGQVTVSLGFNPAPGARFNAPNAIVIPDGQNAGSVTLNASQNSTDENDLTVTISITGVNGNAEEDGDQTATVTIRDNDEPGGGGGGGGDDATISFASAEETVAEDAGTFDLVLSVSGLDSDATATVTLSSGDPADLGGFQTREVEIAAGATSVTVPITITDDEAEEEDETFTFQLTSDDAEIDLGTTTLVVTDDDEDTGGSDGLTITEIDSIVSDDDEPFVEIRKTSTGPLVNTFVVYLDADSTVLEVDDISGTEADDNGFIVIEGEDVEDGGRRAALVPEDFSGVAIVTGEAPEVGTTFVASEEQVVDLVFFDEADAAAARGLDPEDGSLQLQAGGGFEFGEATPGAENTVIAPVSTTGGPSAEFVGDVYPNPSAGRATVELAVQAAQRVQVTVYDALGRQVATAYDGEAVPGAALRVSLSGTGLAPGVYVVRVAGETFTTSRRLTVTR